MDCKQSCTAIMHVQVAMHQANGRVLHGTSRCLMRSTCYGMQGMRRDALYMRRAVHAACGCNVAMCMLYAGRVSWTALNIQHAMLMHAACRVMCSHH